MFVFQNFVDYQSLKELIMCVNECFAHHYLILLIFSIPLFAFFTSTGLAYDDGGLLTLYYFLYYYISIIIMLWIPSIIHQQVANYIKLAEIKLSHVLKNIYNTQW